MDMAATSSPNAVHPGSIVEGPSEIIMSSITNTVLKVTPLVPVGKTSKVAGHVTDTTLSGVAHVDRGVRNRSAIADDILMPTSTIKHPRTCHNGSRCTSKIQKSSDSNVCGLWASLLSGVNVSDKPCTREQNPKLVAENDENSSDWSVVDDTHSDLSSHLEPVAVGSHSPTRFKKILPRASASGGLSPESDDGFLSPSEVSDSSPKIIADFDEPFLLDKSVPDNARHAPASSDSLVDDDVALSALTIEEIDKLLAADEALLFLEDRGGPASTSSSSISAQKAISAQDDGDSQKTPLWHPLLTKDQRCLATAQTRALPTADDFGVCHHNSPFIPDRAIRRHHHILSARANNVPSMDLDNERIKQSRDAAYGSRPGGGTTVTDCSHGGKDLAAVSVIRDVDTQPFATAGLRQVRSQSGRGMPVSVQNPERDAIPPTQPMVNLSWISSRTLPHIMGESLPLAPPSYRPSGTVDDRNLGRAAKRPSVQATRNKHDSKIVGVHLQAPLIPNGIAPTQAMEDGKASRLPTACPEIMPESRSTSRYACPILPTQPMPDPYNGGNWQSSLVNNRRARRCFEGPVYKKMRTNNGKPVRTSMTTILQATQPMDTMGTLTATLAPTQPMNTSGIDLR